MQRSGNEMEIKKIKNIAWCLPRPRRVKYPGGFPLHAEIKILREIGCDPKKNKNIKILHPFGGMAEYGERVDINPEVKPDYVGDAHNMDFIPSESYDCVILDPPYNEEYSKRLYGTKKPQWKKYTTEAVRVLKEEGYLVVYHYLATPRIQNTVLVKRILLETRLWHKLRCVHIHQKRTERGEEQCHLFDTKKSSRCKKDYIGTCECQFDVSFKSDSIKPSGEPPWK